MDESNKLTKSCRGMLPKHLFYLGLFTVICFDGAVGAQKWNLVTVVPEQDLNFEEALEVYRLENYQAAFEHFDVLTTAEKLHQRMTVSLLMAGKSLIKLERYADAILYFDRLVDLFPQSSYADDALFAEATCNYYLDKYPRAMQNWFLVVDLSSQAPMIDKSSELANMIMRRRMSLEELRSLRRFAKGENSLALLALQLAERELTEGSTERAIRILEEYKDKFNSARHAASVDQLLSEAQTPGSRAVKVGVVLPLSGYFSAEGRGVLRGIRFAQMKNKQNAGKRIELLVRDSQSHVTKALRETRALIKRHEVKSIIGELESEITAAIGALASESGVPVIGPAASKNHVAAVGESVYQLNSDLEIKGEALAQYAFNVLGFRTFATLAPADEYGQQLTDSFTAKIDRLGGRIIAQSFYYGEPEDLSRHFKGIREAAFNYDSTDVEKLIEEAIEQGEKLEEKDIPVLSVDAIFLPVYSDHIKYVAPHFAFSNIRAQILGGDGWHDLEVLRQAQVEKYVNGTIFVSDYFADEERSEYRDFRNAFRIAMRRTPEKWETFGYDALSVLLQAINDGAKTGAQINQKVATISNFGGVKGEISFKGNNRVNREVNFLQFLNGNIIRNPLIEVTNGKQ